jgi:hypothetical protein
MHPFRTAILVFVVGASVANYFAMKQYDDRFAPSVSPTPTATYEADPWAGPPSASSSQPDSYTAGLESAAKDKAWMREAIIITIAGVAWFLLPGKNSKPSS